MVRNMGFTEAVFLRLIWVLISRLAGDDWLPEVVWRQKENIERHLLLTSGEVLRQLFCDIAVSRGLRMAPGTSRTIPVPQFILRQACCF